MVVLLIVSLVLLFIMPAESEELTDELITYGSVVLYAASVAMAGAVVYFRRVDGRGRSSARPVPDDEVEEEYRDEISEIEREFEALEKEIEREERS